MTGIPGIKNDKGESFKMEKDLEQQYRLFDLVYGRLYRMRQILKCKLASNFKCSAGNTEFI
jgi:hypothetical protein